MVLAAKLSRVSSEKKWSKTAKFVTWVSGSPLSLRSKSRSSIEQSAKGAGKYLLQILHVSFHLILEVLVEHCKNIRFYSVSWINGVLHTVTHLIMTFICVRIYNFLSPVGHLPELNTIMAANIFVVFIRRTMIHSCCSTETHSCGWTDKILWLNLNLIFDKNNSFVPHLQCLRHECLLMIDTSCCCTVCISRFIMTCITRCFRLPECNVAQWTESMFTFSCHHWRTINVLFLQTPLRLHLGADSVFLSIILD